MEIIEKLAAWGDCIREASGSEWEEIQLRTINRNPWFTAENQDLALQGILHFLDKQKLSEWLSHYAGSGSGSAKQIGTVMAGNIPMVGFHDLLCILASGDFANVKLSSKDDVLLPYLVKKLSEVDQTMAERVMFKEKLAGLDAMIATGSDNSARYFEYYFRDIPHIIRKNRTSVAILTGDETDNELRLLGNDITQFFGLGCRNVSKVFVPKDYEFTRFFEQLDDVSKIINHSKYANNYDYNKSIYLVNKQPFLDTGFLMFTESEQLVSPISVVFYEHYENLDDAKARINSSADKIQCIVSSSNKFPDSVAFGNTQEPKLWDYADNVDTMKFLEELE